MALLMRLAQDYGWLTRRHVKPAQTALVSEARAACRFALQRLGDVEHRVDDRELLLSQIRP